MGYTIGSYSIEFLLLAISLMTVLSIVSSKVSSFFGVPSLLLFLGIGMLAGSEGPGGIDFTNYSLAFIIGSISLVFILFDGGFRTSWPKVKPILPLGIMFSSFAVVLTCGMVGLFSHYVLSLGWAESFLLGAIVSSTDAAAVFSILRSKNLSLRGSLKEVLEFEAGSNDPMAIFLTIGLIQFLTSDTNDYSSFFLLFANQAIKGAILGWFGGKSALWVMNNIKVDQDGLYSVLMVGMVLLIFSTTNALGGSGFLAVYIAGIVMGNAVMVKKYSLLLFNDGVAWIAQISLFLVLGLLVFPSHLLDVWKEGTILAIFMMLVARPVSVFLSSLNSRLKLKEKTFISWVGLRGAAPIILAILPWSAGLERAEFFFNLVFFIVLLSVLIQGMTIPWMATQMGVSEATVEEESGNVAILPRGFVNVELHVESQAPAEGQRTVDLELPAGVLLLSLEREGRFIIPRGDTQFHVSDKLVALARPSNLKQLQEIFGTGRIVT